MTLFDTHAHYYDEKFGSDSERREVIGKIRQAGVKYVINAGTNPDSSRLSLALADEYDGFYAAVGLHPEDIFDISDPEAAFSEIRKLAASEKAVAVGEIGLDYHWHGEPSEREFQKYWFSRQLELACELGQISTAMVQRRLKVGYARAGRIIDQMEMRGIISGANGSKPREVLISKYSIGNNME